VSGFVACRVMFDASVIHFTVALLMYQVKHILGLVDL